MKKSLTAIAVAAALALPVAANAGVYGAGNVAVVGSSADGSELTMDTSSKRGNAIGAKGSMDTSIADFQATYKIEIGLNGENTTSTDDKSAAGVLFQRDTNIGLASKSMGSVTAGTISVGYKRTGKMIDPNFTTPFEGRGGFGMSGQQGGTGDGKGRSTNTVEYVSPSISGAMVNAHYNLADGAKNNMGGGLTYGSGPVKAFAQYMTSAEDKSFTKFGGSFSMSGATIGAQYEMYADATTGGDVNDYNQLFANVAYGMGASSVNFTFGSKSPNDDTVVAKESTWALVAQHKASKKATIYAGYGSMTIGDLDAEGVYGAGMKVKF